MCIRDSSGTIRDSFGLYLNKSASQLVNSITGGIYSSMSVDENLNIFMNTPTRLVPVEQVSSGTMDQIYLALRLAAARPVSYTHLKSLPIRLLPPEQLSHICSESYPESFHGFQN